MRTVKPAAKADINGEVQGTGFTSTRGKLSTDFEGYTVTNNVQISSGEFRFTDSVTTLIKPIVGSTLVFSEHGSGSYQAEEQLDYSSVSMIAERNILASSSPAHLNLGSCTISIDSFISCKVLYRVWP